MSTKTKVAVMGQLLEVEEVDSLPSDCNGHCDPQRRVIKIRKDLPEDEKSCVVHHEIGHYIWYRFLGTESECNEEMFCRMLEMVSTIHTPIVVSHKEPDVFEGVRQEN